MKNFETVFRSGDNIAIVKKVSFFPSESLEDYPIEIEIEINEHFFFKMNDDELVHGKIDFPSNWIPLISEIYKSWFNPKKQISILGIIVEK